MGRHLGLEHAAVENGPRSGKHPAAPILLDDVPLNENELLKLLNQQGGEFPESYLRFIQDRICDHMDATLKN